MPDRPQEPFAFVIFGASSDLSRRRLIPALYHLADLEYMPNAYAVVGVSRSPMTDEAFREIVRQAISEHGKEDQSPAAPDAPQLLPFVYFYSGDSTSSESLRGLKTRLQELDARLGLHGNRLFYLAVAPDPVPTIVDNLHGAGMLDP